MNPELSETIDQLKHIPQGKLLPCLLLMGSSLTQTDPEPWLVDAINHLQRQLSEKQTADLFFLMGTHTIKLITNNELTSLFDTDKPSLENIDVCLAEAIKSLHQMVLDQQIQASTLNTFYGEVHEWLSNSLQRDISQNNTDVVSLVNSIELLTQRH